MGAQAIPCLKHYPATSTATTLPEENLAPTNRDYSGNNRAPRKGGTETARRMGLASYGLPTRGNCNGLQHAKETLRQPLVSNAGPLGGSIVNGVHARYERCSRFGDVFGGGSNWGRGVLSDPDVGQ